MTPAFACLAAELARIAGPAHCVEMRRIVEQLATEWEQLKRDNAELRRRVACLEKRP